MQKLKLFFETRLLRKEGSPERSDVQVQKPDTSPSKKEVDERTKNAEAEVRYIEKRSVEIVSAQTGLKVRTNENPQERDYVFMDNNGVAQFNMMYDKGTDTYVVIAPDQNNNWQKMEGTRSSTITGLISHLKEVPFRDLKAEKDVLNEFSRKSGLDYSTKSLDAGKTTDYLFTRVDGQVAFHVTYSTKEKKYYLVQHSAAGENAKSSSSNIRDLLVGFDLGAYLAKNEH